MLNQWIKRVFGGRKAKPAKVEPAPIENLADRRARIAAGLRVIARDQHSISRKQISQNALRVLYKLRDAGFHAYLVGGAVRDLMLGITPKDFDVATDAHPEQVKQLFRNCRLIGRRFRLAHVHFGDEIIEVATFRGSAADEDGGAEAREVVDGRILRDNVYGSIEEDAIRRDFTVNALYYAIEDFSVRDYVGAVADIDARLLRLIGDPTERYREDPVRMLRACRLAAKLNFTVEATAARAMHDQAALILNAAPARLFDECLKLFMSGHGLRSYQQLTEHGMFNVLFPELAEQVAAHAGARQMVEAALNATDQRVLDGRPVTPAYLFAAMFWPWLVEARKRLPPAQAPDATRIAGERVLDKQVRRIALPKRYSVPMAEIWALQDRLEASRKKRAGKLASHPKFRAAYDFLCLRAEFEPGLKDQVHYWQQVFQQQDQRGQADGSDPDAPEAESPEVEATEVPDGSPKKKRRRRRRKPKTAPSPAP
ncbi:polynucleotide adenylyltransferase PcnB [Ahniella affigens]|uniref:Poly(A) polymerase I n=1 Tax=Ahniella affigens TaxID=2021234 RepID=A0A2P1PPV1_9GAMM|nr:polynucleotide adenylyltransferase PcnB [Ahniella affigens]AVP96871.1 polynucleotide adenylyltransferase PcnB [Ahniella affigens]